MVCFIRRLIASAIFIAIGVSAVAQQVDTISAKVYFHRAMYDIDLGYANNGATLNEFVKEFTAAYGSDPQGFSYILVRTGCSPEGGIEYNQRLAFNRAMSIKYFLVSRLGLSESQVRIKPVGIDWSGLRVEMAKEYFPGRWDMFKLMERYGVKSSEERGDEARCQIEMIRDRGGEPWRWMSKNIFPALRSGEGQISVIIDDNANDKLCQADENCCPGRRDTLVIIHKDTVYMKYDNVVNDRLVYVQSQTRQAARKDMGATMRRAQRDSLLRVPVMAFRSNLLLPAMNVGVEFPLGNRWSVAADWYYPWIWRPWMNAVYPAQKNCAEFLGGYLEARYWFGGRHTPSLSNRKYRLSGHSLALIGGTGYYDYGHGWSGTQGEIGVIGLDYMYSVILGRGNAHMDFDIGLGYFQMQNRTYEVYEVGGKLYGDLQQYHSNYVLPIKAGVSLVLPLFKKEEINTDDAE